MAQPTDESHTVTTVTIGTTITTVTIPLIITTLDHSSFDEAGKAWLLDSNGDYIHDSGINKIYVSV